MAAIIYSNDGTRIFIAVEDIATGDQVVLRSNVSDFSGWSYAYNPEDGSAVNIKASPSDPDVLFFYGNFGTDVVIIKNTISTQTNTDISPASLGAKIINVLNVNPTALYDGNVEIVAHVNTDNDVIYSDDSGATWTTWNAASGVTATALEIIWGGSYFPHGYILGGNNTTAELWLSPNEGGTSLEITDTISATHIVGIQFTGT